jgi:hypothetical protein
MNNWGMKCLNWSGFLKMVSLLGFAGTKKSQSMTTIQTASRKLASFLFILSLFSVELHAQDQVVLCPQEITLNLEVPNGFKGPEYYSKINFIGAHFKDQTLACFYGAGRIKIEQKISAKFCQLKETTAPDPAIKNSPACLGTRVQCSLICQSHLN